MKYVAIAAVIILLPFGVLMVAIPLAINKQIAAVSPNWKPDYCVIYWLRFWTLILGVPFELGLAIFYNEGASNARSLTDAELTLLQMDPSAVQLGYPLGDTTISRGPSVGPGQVLRTNILALWEAHPSFVYSAPSAYHLALKEYTRQAVWASVQVMKKAYSDAGGNLQLSAQYYNGGEPQNPDPRAVAYAQKAADTMDRIANA